MTDTITTLAAIGIDLGDKDAHYACLNEEGKFTEEGTVAMTPAGLRKHFAKLPRTRIAIEAGAQSRWIAKALGEFGHEVIVANPRQLPLISANISKNDSNDAKLLARLARVDPSLLSPLEHRGEKEQTTLLTIRARAQLVKTRVALMLSLRSMVKGFGVRLPDANSDQFLQRCKSRVPEALLPHLEGIFTAVQVLTQQIDNYDERIEKIAAEQYPAVQRLTQVPGVGTLTALTYIATIADPGRFAKSRAVGAFLGLRPRQQQSGGKNPQLGITKAGDVYLRKLLVQGSHCLLSRYGQDTALKQWGTKLCERGGANAKRRAIVAVARKMAVLLHKLWVSGDFYRPFPNP
jgi:transposase